MRISPSLPPEYVRLRVVSFSPGHRRTHLPSAEAQTRVRPSECGNSSLSVSYATTVGPPSAIVARDRGSAQTSMRLESARPKVRSQSRERTRESERAVVQSTRRYREAPQTRQKVNSRARKHPATLIATDRTARAERVGSAGSAYMGAGQRGDRRLGERRS